MTSATLCEQIVCEQIVKFQKNELVKNTTFCIAYSLWFSRICHEFSIFFANLVWSHHYSWNHFEYIFCLENSLWIHSLFRKFTIFFLKRQWIRYLFRELTMNSLSVSRILYKFRFVFHELTMNSHSVFRRHY